MIKREALKIKKLIILYNTFQVIFNGILVIVVNLRQLNGFFYYKVLRMKVIIPFLDIKRNILNI